MIDRQTRVDGTRRASARTVLLLLLAVTLIPTACILYFLGVAVRSERLAVRQRLTDAYHAQLEAAQREIDAWCRGKLDVLATTAKTDESPAELFAALVEPGTFDSAIVYGAAGDIAYPIETRPVLQSDQPAMSPWTEAQSLERDGRGEDAAAAYKAVAEEADNTNLAARALQAQARCLARAGRTEEAIAILGETLADEKYRGARDASGRLIAPSALLRAVQLAHDARNAEKYYRIWDRLSDELRDYGGPVMPSSQRRFLMRELQNLPVDMLPGDLPSFETLPAEDLAAEVVEAGVTQPASAALEPSAVPGVWQIASPDRTLVALFRQDRLMQELRHIIDTSVSLPGARVRLVPPPHSLTTDNAFLALPAGDHLPGWRIALDLEGDDPFAAAAQRQVAVYVWTGALLILVIAGFALAIAGHVGRQMKLTRLKNDLIATVSHELKTPLASMRVLVDTLIEGNVRDNRQAQEYLELIAGENVRLSRLIDNFLAFSRMERNKRAFESADVAVGDVVAEAAGAVRERFSAPGCSFEVDAADDLPAIIADRDALVTVVVNLLDNAWKYSGDQKRISLRASSDADSVSIAVTDNGVGLSRRAAKRIFDRFYQVDPSLSREAGGCGLGLAIVKFIVDAHGGSVDVESEPGKGSTFTVKLPIREDRHAS